MSDDVLPPDSYCAAAPGHPFHGPYHDTEYGFPTANEAALFERLVLEINQAGLSWLTILKKRAGFVAAYDGFDADNDPHGERDFGDLALWEATLLFKIEYYDSDMQFGSDDPANSSVTRRVLTVMTSSDW